MSTDHLLDPSDGGLLVTDLPERKETVEELFCRYAVGDLDAREALLQRHMPLARRLVGRYRNTAEAREDLEQVAYVGLLKAIDRYDAGAGPFLRYAVTTIRGELKRHFRDKGWGVRMSRPMQERWLEVKAATQSLTASLGRSPSPRDIAEKTGLTLEEVLEALAAADAYSPRPLDAPIAEHEDSSLTLGDSLGSEDPGYGNAEVRAAIGPALATLPERERRILALRFSEDLTQVEIAGQLGISQMHVSRLLRRSLETLSQSLEGS
jgi:RNA polymerase sigma-B factor